MEPEKKVIKRKRTYTQILSAEQKEKVHKVAFYLSKYEHEGIFEEDLNQGETINKLANKLNVKPNTLKNKRDLFDPYCSKKRVGWVQQAKLSDELQEIFDNYKSKSNEEILKEIQGFLL